MPSVASSLNELLNSIVAIFTGLFHSVLAVFHAILALGKDIVGAVVNLCQALLKAGVGIVGSTVGLIWANLFVIALFAGGYYLYQTNAQGRTRGGKKRA